MVASSNIYAIKTQGACKNPYQVVAIVAALLPGNQGTPPRKIEKQEQRAMQQKQSSCKSSKKIEIRKSGQLHQPRK